MEYTVRAEESGRKVREILLRSMDVSYTALKSAKWSGRIRIWSAWEKSGTANYSKHMEVNLSMTQRYKEEP